MRAPFLPWLFTDAMTRWPPPAMALAAAPSYAPVAAPTADVAVVDDTVDYVYCKGTNDDGTPATLSKFLVVKLSDAAKRVPLTCERHLVFVLVRFTRSLVRCEDPSSKKR